MNWNTVNIQRVKGFMNQYKSVFLQIEEIPTSNTLTFKNPVES